MATTSEVSLTHAQRDFSELIDRVMFGETVFLTKHGRAVAKLTRCTGVGETKHGKKKIRNAE